MNGFAAKVVLITGAAGGIGRALCAHFAERGARIAALDKAEVAVCAAAEDLRREGAVVEALGVDVTDFAAVAAAVDWTVERLGPVDVLVNNAGFAERETLAKTSPMSWRHELDGNVTGSYHCVQAVSPVMKERRSGVIVNVGSVNGLTALGHPAYSAAKAALVNFTKALAVEYGRFGIRANIVCPGTVRTPAWTERVERNPQIFTRLTKWYPLGRIVEPSDVAKAVGFLASDDAAAISGAVLTVDCGLTAGNAVMATELTLESV